MNEMMPAPATMPAEGAVPVPEGVTVAQYDPQAILTEVSTFYERAQQERRPYEYDWFLNAATVRSASDAKFHPLTSQLQNLTAKEPPHRRHYRINRTRVKYLAKVAKYTNSRPRPYINPASDDREDLIDAKLTEQALKYYLRKTQFEGKYERIAAAAEITGKTFVAVRWDPKAKARVRDPRNNEPVEITAGDVAIDLVSAFEILVDDLGIETLAEQPAIMRIRLMSTAEVEARHGVKVEGDASSADLFQFQKQIAGLGAKYNANASFVAEGLRAGSTEKKKDYVIVKEFFKRPSAAKPGGCYALVAGGQLLDYREEMPYGYGDFENPYPFEEFASSISPGQFYPPTMVEQLRPVQENYSTFRSKLIEHLLLNLHGKLLVPRAAKVPDNAWNSEPGEKIPFTYIPGMPLPMPVHPPALSMDVWRLFDLLIREFDEVSNISAATLGLGSDSESGYQATVLQEANDAVFGPDRNRLQRSLAQMLGKVRRLMARGYTEERLVAATGRANAGTMFVFTQSNIDEAAEIVVEIGSALPDGKAARLQTLMQLKGTGLFGDAENPRVRRGILELADLGGIEEEVDPEYQDAQRARRENLMVERGMPLPPPLPWHKDPVHVVYHEEFLNSPSFDILPVPGKVSIITHYLLHLRKLDPVKGLDVAQMFASVAPEIAQMVPMFDELVRLTLAPQPAPGTQPGAAAGAAPSGPAPFGGGQPAAEAPPFGGAAAPPAAA